MESFFLFVSRFNMQLQSLIGKKTYQKSGFLQDGQRVPLTGVAVAGNFVTQIKTNEKDGYISLQLGIGINNKAKKRIINHSKKAGLKETPRFLKEIAAEDLEGVTAGMEINAAEVFAPGDIVDVTGTSKGKGWAGGVKRWNFKGGPRTHGQSDRERAPGSIGQTTTPGRVYKGKKMAGRMGTDTVTVKNLEVIGLTNDGLLLIKGLIPGFINGYVVIKKVGENKKFVPMYSEVIDEPETPVEAQETAQEASDTQVEEVSVEQVSVEQVSEAAAEPAAEPEAPTEEVKEEVKEDANS